MVSSFWERSILCTSSYPDGLFYRGQWSRWSYCNATCGTGFKNRVRICDSPKPENGGFSCQGQDMEVTDCQASRKCQPISGQWTAWSRWSGCSEPCGKGSIIRTRTCTNPSPMHGGADCVGNSSQKRPCYLGKCSVDSDTVQDQEVDKRIIINGSCHFPPRIYGYMGPYQDTYDLRRRLHSNWTAGLVHQNDFQYFNDSSKALYVCHGGKVTNTMTNTRHVTLQCLDGEFVIPRDLPRCVTPTHCLGPARTSNFTETQPYPFRDLEIGSFLTYQCQQPDHYLLGSCFMDGQYRYSSSFPQCSLDPENLKLLCLHELVHINHPGDYGFILGENSYSFSVKVKCYTFFSIDKGRPSMMGNGTRCQMKLSVARGLKVGLKVGVETKEANSVRINGVNIADLITYEIVNNATILATTGVQTDFAVHYIAFEI